jgi:hypothetical protein
MSRRKNNFSESAILNNGTYGFYLSRLMELAISMFEWKNVPDSIDPRFLELTLFSDGQAVWFKDEEMDKYLALQVIINGQLDVYRVPIRRRAYAVNGYQRNLDNKNSVIIYNNFLRSNSYQMCVLYAKKLYNLDRIIDVNTNAQKTPVLITVDENQRLTAENVYQKWDGNQPVIYGDKMLNPELLRVLKTDAPYVSDKLYQLKTQYWNEALTYLGISNLNVQKKERLVSDEVVRSQGGTIASRYSRLEARREACRKINDMFGLNIDVDYREDFREMDDETMFTGDSASGEMKTMVTDLRTR